MNKNDHKQLFEEWGIKTPLFTLCGTSGWCRVVSVYDGDTMKCVIPVFGGYYKFNTRISGIDTCEIRSKTEENKTLALRARDRLITLITGGKITSTSTDFLSKSEIDKIFDKDVYLVWIDCGKFDKYGRILVDIKINCDDAETVSDILIREGLAYRYSGDTKMTEEEQRNILKIQEEIE